MKTIICGSRSLTGPTALSLVARAIARARQEMGITPTSILTGGALGIDQAACDWAQLHGLPVRTYHADWLRHGMAAGPRRNTLMVGQADALVAVWDGRSRGTRHALRTAYSAGLLTHLLIVEPPQPLDRPASPQLILPYTT